MSPFTFHRPGSRDLPLPSLAGVRVLAGRVAGTFEAVRAARAMQALDDAALHDIGVARGAIDAAVRHGRTGLRRR